MRSIHTLRVGVLVGVMMLYAGCDSLDVTDPNAPNPDDVTIQSLVAGVEGSLRADYGIYLRVVAAFGREAYYFEPADPRYVGELYTGPLDPGGFLLTRPWGSRYRTIQNAVTLLGRADELSAEGQAGVEGFANTIIGYQLMLNLILLDENGIKIEFSEDINTPFVSSDQGYAEVIRYLDEGNARLGAAGSAFAFQLTSGFAGFDTPAAFSQFNRALRARAAIYQDDPAAALTALGGSFLDAAGDMDAGVYHAYGSGTGDRLNPMFEVPTSSTVKLRAHPDFGANAEAGDQRYASKVLDRSAEAGFDPAPAAGGGLSSALVATVAASSTAPYPLIRNEELLLLRAEAYIMQSDYANAQTDINTVRAAAGLADVTITADNAVDQLLQERFYSLFLEGHRWNDMRRYNRLDTLPNDRDGDQIFSQMPRPQSEVPES